MAVPTWAEVTAVQTSRLPGGALAGAAGLELAGAAGLELAGDAAGDDELAAGPELPLHAASPAVASASAPMVRAARPGAASGAARQTRASRLLTTTVISPMSGLPVGKDGTRSGTRVP
jgi:hypothetical protein